MIQAQHCSHRWYWFELQEQEEPKEKFENGKKRLKIVRVTSQNNCADT